MSNLNLDHNVRRLAQQRADATHNGDLNAYIAALVAADAPVVRYKPLKLLNRDVKGEMRENFRRKMDRTGQLGRSK